MYIEIDVQAELEPYLDRFDNARQRGDKLQSSSPFRDDRKPSFAVNLIDGTWVDSGATTDGESRGNFVKLLALLQGITYEESLQDIKERYGLSFSDVEALELDLKLANPFQQKEKVKPLEQPTSIHSAYLEGRGIPLEIQDLFGITVINGAVGFPVQDRDGQVVNVKYRKIGSKQFWYERDLPIKQYLYGLYQALDCEADTVFVTEGEVDALYLWSHGVPAVATFGASITDKQLSALRRFKRVVLATDNDEVGQKFRDFMKDRLFLDVELGILQIPEEYKDVNEMPSYKLVRAIEAVEFKPPEFDFVLA